MDNGYCIYIGEKPYFIVSQLNEKLNALANSSGTILVNQPNAEAIVAAIHDLEKTNAVAAIILTSKVDFYWQIFKEQFNFIQAAGGLVVNEKGEYLFIFRRGKWDLPKGKLDEGENLESCAVREIQEETGLQIVLLKKYLCSTFHIYPERGKNILKESVWYLMNASSNDTLTPQTEEDITAIKWLKKDALQEVFANTYPSIKEVLLLNY